MKTAEDCLSDNVSTFVLGNVEVHKKYILYAMEEYALQQAKAFAEWLETSGWNIIGMREDDGKWVNLEGATAIYKTTDELYQIFLKDHGKKDN